MGQRSREDLECLGRGKWRCRNCDAVLSEGAALMHHHRRDCRHPQSASRAVDRERKCLGCRAALAQLSALRERAAADGSAAAAPADDEDEDEDDDAEDAEDAEDAGARGAAWERVVRCEGAAWRRRLRRLGRAPSRRPLSPELALVRAA